MIAFDFDRAKMGRRLATYSAILLGGFAFMFLGLPLSHSVGTGWEWSILALTLLVVMHVLPYLLWVGIITRGLRRKGAAIIVNQIGIIDNASDYTLGQLGWEEIEKMYPWDWKSRLLSDRWEKMPVLSKERGIVVELKDGVDLQRLLLGKPRFIRSLTRPWYVGGRGRWLFIPEMVLTVTADDLMTRLNDFYTTQVRGY